MEITAAIVKEKRANFELTKVTLDKLVSEEVLVKIGEYTSKFYHHKKLDCTNF